MGNVCASKVDGWLLLMLGFLPSLWEIPKEFHALVHILAMAVVGTCEMCQQMRAPPSQGMYGVCLLVTLPFK